MAGAPYRAGLLALREGPLLESAVRALPRPPDVLLVNATGRDHPRGAGLALHLGAVLDLPTVGVTHRPLLATGQWPEPVRGAHSPLTLGRAGPLTESIAAESSSDSGSCSTGPTLGGPVGHWLCTQTGKRPLAVHAAWRTTTEVAMAVTLAVTSDRFRTPQPIRLARRAARLARAGGIPSASVA